MPLTLEIPDSVAAALRLPEADVEAGLRRELALALYADGILSFGKARQLACLGKYEFGRLLGDHGISRHYAAEELADDVAYARSQ